MEGAVRNITHTADHTLLLRRRSWKKPETRPPLPTPPDWPKLPPPDPFLPHPPEPIPSPIPPEEEIRRGNSMLNDEMMPHKEQLLCYNPGS
jgi:hypothetical protein